MTNLVFKTQGNKVFLCCNTLEKEVSKETFVEVCQLVLGNISPNRDYSSITSLSKLFSIIHLECSPDESDSENEVVEVPKPVVVVSKPTTLAAKTAVRKPAAPVKKEESDEEENEDSD